MGCFYELNDTLLLSEDQGFPSNVFNYEKHLKNPITLKDVEGKIFHFKNKPAARAFQLDPVRVYFVERTKNDKWLFWGKVLIQSLTIEKIKKQEKDENSKNPIAFDAGDWITSGTYKILEVYDPAYQKQFTMHEAPAVWNFFGK